MLRGIGKFLLCAALTLALGGLAQNAWASCGCGRCAKKSCGCQRESCGSKCGSKSCGCNKCAKSSCSKCGKKSCNTCGPRQWCADPGIGGYKLDLGCADACCIEKPCEQEVCVEGWDLCEKWCDGLVHHPYELVFNGHGNMCDYSPCEAFIPCTRHGVSCKTTCGECGPETTCEDITRPRTIPWWFNPGHGNTYLDESGNPVCGQTLPPKEAPPVAPPAEQPPVVAPPAPPAPPTPPAPPAPPEQPVVVDGRG
jgi:hypothetical protein